MPRPDPIGEARRDGLLGQLLQLYRNYLRLLAESQLDRKLRARVGPSDIVQETLIAAYRDYHQFVGPNGTRVPRLVATDSDQPRIPPSRTPCARRETRCPPRVSLEQVREAWSVRDLPASDPGRSRHVPQLRRQQGESIVRLADCLTQLAPHHREVLMLRHFQGLPFECVAREMGRSPGSTRVLWLRAIRRLRELFDREEPA